MGFIYTIPASLPFAASLAKGLIGKYNPEGKTPEALSQIQILLPSSRACDILKNAFLQEGDGRLTLLPRLIPI